MAYSSACHSSNTWGALTCFTSKGTLFPLWS